MNNTLQLLTLLTTLLLLLSSIIHTTSTSSHTVHHHPSSTTTTTNTTITNPPPPHKPHKIGNTYRITISTNLTTTTIPPHISPTGHTYTYTLHHPNATYLSVHFHSLDLTPPCVIQLKERSSGGLYSEVVLQKKGFHDLETFWAHHVRSDTMIITLMCRGVSVEESGSFFVVDDYAAGLPTEAAAAATAILENNDAGGDDDGNDDDDNDDEVTISRRHHLTNRERQRQRRTTICGSDDRRNAICYSNTPTTQTHYLRSRSVARLWINGQYTCTGFLISHSPSLLLTNHHCLRRQQDVDNTEFEFMGEEPTCGSDTGNCLLCDRGVVYDGRVLLYANEEYDVALVELEGNPALAYGYLHLDHSSPIFDLVNRRIYIPQHPYGRAKEIALSDSTRDDNVCTITGVRRGCTSPNYDDVMYGCDTEGGTSGAPVLDGESHEVVALHHCGSTWGSGGRCEGNMAVPVSEFYDAIEGFLMNSSQGHDEGEGQQQQQTQETMAPTVTPMTMPPTIQCKDDDQSSFILKLTTDMFSSETSWVLAYAQSSSRVQSSRGAIVTSSHDRDELKPNSLTIVEECLSKNCYVFRIYDEYQDGICCSYGEGRFEVMVDGVVVGEGDDFGDVASVSFGTCRSPPQSSLSLPEEAQEVVPNNVAPIGVSPVRQSRYVNFDDPAPAAHSRQYDIFTLSGNFASWHRGNVARSPPYSIVLRGYIDESSVSQVTTAPIDVSRYMSVQITFYYHLRSFDADDDVAYLESSTDGGQSWSSPPIFATNMRYDVTAPRNYQWMSFSHVVPTLETSSLVFRWRCEAIRPKKRLYIDDVTIEGLLPIENTRWDFISHDDFEDITTSSSSLSSFDMELARHEASVVAHSGTALMEVRHEENDNQGGSSSSSLSSFVSSEIINVKDYVTLQIHFWYYAVGFRRWDQFWVESSSSSSSSSSGTNYDDDWKTVVSYQRGEGRQFGNNQWVMDIIDVDTIGMDEVRVRFRCDDEYRHEQVFIDDVTFFGLRRS